MEIDYESARHDPRLQSLIFVMMQRLKADLLIMYDKLKALPIPDEEEGNCLTLYLNDKTNNKLGPRLFQIQTYHPRYLQGPHRIHMFLFRQDDQKKIFEHSSNDWPTIDNIWNILKGESIYSIVLTHGSDTEESINTARQ